MSRLSEILPAFSLSTWLFAVFPLCFASYWLLWIVYARTLHPLASIPGPFWASISRLWYMYRVYAGDMHHVQRALHEKYGPVVRIAPDEISTAEVSAIPKIYKYQNPLAKSDFYTTWTLGGKGYRRDLFSENDEKRHSSYRRVVNPVYTLANVLKSESYINSVSELFIQRLGEHADRKEPIDFGHWLQMYAFDVIGEIFFGGMFGFLEHSEDYGTYIESIDSNLPFVSLSAIGPFYLRPLIMSAFMLPAALKAAKAVAGVQQVAINATKKRLQDIQAGTVPRVDMLQQIFDIIHEKGEKVGITERDATMEAWVALFAGSDTTATAFRATFYYLMRNPEKLKKARAEIDAALAAGSLSSPIKYSETTTKLPYICACIKEATRMHPSIGLSMQRLAPEEGIQTAGKFIPKGYRVGLNPAVVQYDKEVFGQDADVFRPERWLVSEEEWKAMDKSMLLFGAGTRVCVGKNISLVELHTLVPEVLRHFNLEMTHNRPWTTCNRWFHKQTGLTVNVTRR